MQINDIISALRSYIGLWFHKRNIIIVSEHRVKHIPVSGRMQFAGLLMAVACIFWASYSTGRFIATRNALQEQSHALRSVVTVHVADAALASEIKPAEVSSKEKPAAAVSMEKPELVARVVFLEQQVNDLQAAKDDIIERVRSKTSGHIDDLEAIIKQTGLSPKELKKSLRINPDNAKEAQIIRTGKPVGGPFIPDTSYAPSSSEKELYGNLDDLALLRQIVSNLPLAYPIADGDLQSSFGRRIDPFNGRLAFHSGLDIAGPSGSRVLSTADGIIKEAGPHNNYGNNVDVDHGNGITTRYAHLSRVLVKEGQKVRKGETIGIQGSTGRSTGAHLHYEVRFRDQAMNPKKFLEAGRYVSQE